MKKVLFPLVLLFGLLLSACGVESKLLPIDERNLFIGSNVYINQELEKQCPDFVSWSKNINAFTTEVMDYKESYQNPFWITTIVDAEEVEAGDFNVYFDHFPVTVTLGGYKITGAKRQLAIAQAEELISHTLKYSIRILVTPNLTAEGLSFTYSDLTCTPIKY